MAKIKFEDVNFAKSSLKQIETFNGILDTFVADGYILTLRQLFYQLVGRDLIANSQKRYKALGNLLKNARMAGLVDWNAIEDRIRKPMIPYYVHGVQDAIKDTINQYRINRMDGQEHKIEVWVEKDALSSVLSRITRKYHVRLMVNRGYSSASAMYDAYNRLDDGDTILYFGDHDPSGLDMVRDIKDRLTTFGVDIKVVPVALTMEQIKKYNPPPNPTKLTDSRADWYIDQFGNTSWELDALPPKVLLDLCEDNIKSRIDLDLYNEKLEQEANEKNDLKRLIDIYNDNDF